MYLSSPWYDTDQQTWLPRATTVYLPHRRYDMLPGLLSTDLCSLWSGVDRCAVSVLCELDSSCDVVKVWFGRTVIHSSYKLTYEVSGLRKPRMLCVL